VASGAGQELQQCSDTDSLGDAGNNDHAPSESGGDAFYVGLCGHMFDLAFQSGDEFFGGHC